jgi:hypothetical protein
MAAAVNLLRQLCAVGTAGIAAFGLVLGFVRLLDLTCHAFAFFSPITLKVRLNN